MVSVPPQTTGLAVPLGTLCVLFQTGSSAWGALLKQCGRAVSLIWSAAQFSQQTGLNTVVSLQSAYKTAGKITFFFPDTSFLWLALFYASRHYCVVQLVSV